MGGDDHLTEEDREEHFKKVNGLWDEDDDEDD